MEGRSIRLLAIGSLAFAVGFGGCGSPVGSIAPSPAAGASSSVASTPTPTPPVSASVALPSPTPSAPPDPAAIADLAGTFPGGLWAVRGSTLFVSVDAGTNWRVSSLPSAPAAVGTGVFLLDREHAWSITYGSDSSPFTGSPSDVLHFIVHRTSDGGRTWQLATVPGSYPGTVAQLTFVDALHGYLLCSAIRHSSGRSTILRTVDGGRTWSVAGGGDWLGSMFAASDGTTVWAGAEQEAGPVVRPLLDVSRDGGRTWAAVALPGLAGGSEQAAGGAMRFLTQPPLFLDPSIAIVSIATEDPSAPVTTLYRTSDGGRTWSKAGVLVRDAWHGPAVLDAQHWLLPLPVLNPTGLEATADGGRTWVSVAPVGLPADGLIDWIAGLDAVHAAALVGGPWYPARDELFLTSDAGRTWRPAGLGVAGSTTAP